jgi:hypothetical protein
MRALLIAQLVLHAGVLAAQQKFDVALRIQQGGHETGREEFSLQRVGARAGGSTLVAQARYPGANPTLRIDATLERTPDLSIAKFELDVQAPEGNIVILAAGTGARLIVRSVAKGSEAGREMPGGRNIVLLDDAVFSLWGAIADLATPSGTKLTAVFPRTGRRTTFSARREAGAEGEIRVQLTGDITGSLVTDPQGALQRLELPASGILVSRVAR